jgi:dihydroorotase-like cyclic amidohydrolase
MFTATRPPKYSPSDSRLVQRYCEIFEIDDWRQLSKGQRGAMVFVEMPAFWKARSEWLKTEDPAELLKNTPVEGAHSLKGTPAHKRLNGDVMATEDGYRRFL